MSEAVRQFTVAADGVRHFVVADDDDGVRLDRWFKRHLPQIGFATVSRWTRTGQIRVDGKRAAPEDRLATGQTLRVPPGGALPERKGAPPRKALSEAQIAQAEAMVLTQDRAAIVLNKPPGLATQGGTGTKEHVDGLLDAFALEGGPGGTNNAPRPRLVHRLDKDTSGVLLIARTPGSAAYFSKRFSGRSARKTYWALVAGVPKVRQGRVSTYLAKDEEAQAVHEAKMKIAEHGDEGAQHALTYYAVIEKVSRICSWVSLKPVTGRTHQLRAHMAHIGNPIVGDAKYFDRNDWELPPGLQNKLHLMARRIRIPHPRGKGIIDVSAPLPPHMKQTWSVLNFDADHYDPINDSPEE